MIQRLNETYLDEATGITMTAQLTMQGLPESLRFMSPTGNSDFGLSNGNVTGDHAKEIAMGIFRLANVAKAHKEEHDDRQGRSYETKN